MLMWIGVAAGSAMISEVNVPHRLSTWSELPRLRVIALAPRFLTQLGVRIGTIRNWNTMFIPWKFTLREPLTIRCSVRVVAVAGYESEWVGFVGGVGDVGVGVGCWGESEAVGGEVAGGCGVVVAVVVVVQAGFGVSVLAGEP
jgi:hypothetical protein